MQLKTDNRSRLYGPDVFKPDTRYDAQVTSDGAIRLVELVPAEPPLVRARKVNGRWIGADVKLDRKAVVDSIRADRAER